MSYYYNISDNAPPTLEQLQLHPSLGVQEKARMYAPNNPPEQLSQTFKYNAPSLHTPMGKSAPTPRRKQRVTKLRRTESRTKQKRDLGANDRTNTMTTELTMLLRSCRSNDWTRVLQSLQANPYVALETLTMGNYISTTVLHQAISSKGDIVLRAEVISTILSKTPEAAKMTNGYGSMPLHAIAQRNLKMDSQTKERLMIELVQCYKDALTSNGGIGGRTPLHIIFTDYVSPKLTKFIIENGPEACFMKDNKSCLPAHIACMRHCSPEKLRMLLAVNPAALHAKNDENKTLLDLAKSKATPAHPNYALIDELQKQLAGDISHYDPVIFSTPLPPPPASHSRRQFYNDSNANTVAAPAIVSVASHQPKTYSTAYPPFTSTPSPTGREYHFHYPYSQQPYQRHYLPYPAGTYHAHDKQHEDHTHHSNVGRVSSEDEEADAWNRVRLDSNETWTSPIRRHQSPPPYYPRPISYHHEGGRNDGPTMPLGQRSFDSEPFSTYRAVSHQYTPPSVHAYAPYELNSIVRPQKAHKMHDTPTPSWQRKPKSFTLQVSTKSEEPAAKLLLDFSRNLNSSADDNTDTGISIHMGDDVTDVDTSQEARYTHFVRGYPTYHDMHNIVPHGIPNASLDIATAKGITEV